MYHQINNRNLIQMIRLVPLHKIRIHGLKVKEIVQFFHYTTRL